MASDGEQRLVRVRVRASPNLNPNPNQLNPNPNQLNALASLSPNPDQVSNAPAAWEEDDALRHMSDVGSLVITPRIT